MSRLDRLSFRVARPRIEAPRGFGTAASVVSRIACAGRTLAAVGILLWVAAPALASDTQELAILEAQLGVEEKLLERDLAAFETASARELAATLQALELAEELDQTLRTEGTLLEDLEGQADQYVLAQEAAAGAARLAMTARRQLVERRRRIEVIAARLAEIRLGPLSRDPLSGSWRVEIAGNDRAGDFVFGLDGSVVVGRYQMDDGRRGSLRGTFVDNRLKIERIDAEKGLDGTFEGSIDPRDGTARGFYTPTILGAGAAGGASWTATRVDGETPDSTEDPDEDGEDEESISQEELP